jgi:hypothetical protein
VDQLGSLIISPSFPLFVNLPSGFATWLNSGFALICAGNQQLIKNGHGVHHIQDQVKMFL